MRNEQIMLFEENEVKVVTEEGNILINLCHVAKCCGLTRLKGKSNIQIVRWDRIKEKLNTIYSGTQLWVPQNTESASIEQKYVDEIKYILNEIDETDDRNSIYMSSWLSKRLAMECHSQRSMQFKNFLATLDEKREQGLMLNQNTELAAMVSTTVQSIIPTLVTEITKQFAPVVMESKQSVDNMAKLMHDQSEIYDREREELKDLIGFKSRNTKAMSSKLKEVLEEKLDRVIMASDPQYIKYKTKVFNEFRVCKWEDISVKDYSRVWAFIEECLFE